MMLFITMINRKWLYDINFFVVVVYFKKRNTTIYFQYDISNMILTFKIQDEDYIVAMKLFVYLDLYVGLIVHLTFDQSISL